MAALPPIPPIFEPTKTFLGRGGRPNQFQWEDLSDHKFTAAEKRFICSQLACKSGSEDLLIEPTKYCVGKVHFGKASVQDLDVWHMFSSIKAALLTIVKRGTDVTNDDLKRDLEKYVFVAFKEQYPGVPITSDFKNKIIHGLMACAYVTKKHWNADKMAQSCLETGFHRNGTQPGEDTINFPRLMTRTHNTSAGPEYIAKLIAKSPEVAAEFRRAGNHFLISFEMMHQPP
jgi:hypothetical protein